MHKAIINSQAQRFGKWKTNEEFLQRKTTPVSKLHKKFIGGTNYNSLLEKHLYN